MCNSMGGLTVTKTLPEFTSARGAAMLMLAEVKSELLDQLATGQTVTLRLVKCCGDGQWSIIMDQQVKEEPVQLTLPMMELGVCQQ